MVNSSSSHQGSLNFVEIDERDLAALKINLLFVRYVMASYLYYERDEMTPWSDHEYDFACKRLYEEWDSITHKHKELVDRDSLKAGTGYDIRIYPTITKVSAYQWRDQLLGKAQRIIDVSKERVERAIKKRGRNPVKIEKITKDMFLGTPT